MPLGSRAALFTSFRKARLPHLFLPRATNASVHKSPYTSIADAMLGRAVKHYQPPPPMRPGEKVVTSTHTSSASATKPTIEDILKSRQASQKSISGYTSSPRNTMISQPSFSRQPSQGLAGVMSSFATARKRSSSEMDGSADTPNEVGTSQDKGYGLDFVRPQVARITTARDEFDLDPNDFDNDSDIDLDIEYPQALPSSPARNPLQPVPANLSPRTTQNADAENLAVKHVPPSSAVTWPSSPQAHKQTPPGARFRRQAIEPQQTAPKATLPSSSDQEPRPAKSRKLPWKTKEEDLPEAATNGHTRSSTTASTVQCSRCKKYGHVRAECPRDALSTGRGLKTPLSKAGAQQPWNMTASALKEQSKVLKTQHKKAFKEETTSFAEMGEVVKLSSKSRPAPIFLSDEQKNVLDLVIKQNQSVFFTGSAGTGKSVLMRAIIADLRKQYIREPERVAVTASTGLAACNIGGVTLHSFGGIGLGRESVQELKKKITRNAKAKQRWLRTKVLIIDEISMVDGELFDKLEGLARLIRNNGRPFGGIQLVITGDFFQLPPVPDYKSGQNGVKFAFDASTWTTAINHTIGLTEVFRQRDPVFANMLNEMRLGRITDETIRAFKRLERPIQAADAIEATELFPTRAEVDNSNSFKMRSLTGKCYQFNAEDSGMIQDAEQRTKLLANCMAPPVLELKKGAQVMLIKNIDENLVNGSLGKVIAFMNEKSFEIYDETPGVADVHQAEEEEEKGTSFAEARKKLRESMYNKGLIGDTGREFPLVRFQLADGTSRDLLCQPEDWKVELPNGEVQAQRRQLPLILAWALSIHKAQGQTLERVTVDLKKVFENGQAYVALSRATCQEGLQVKNFNKKAVMAHPKVTKFYESLCSVNKALMHPKLAKIAITKKAKDFEKEFLGGDMLKAQQDFDLDEEEAMAAYG